MRLIFTEKLKEGDIVALNIYDSKGNPLLKKGVSLKQKYIREISVKYNISYIFIEDPRTNDISVKTIMSDELRFESIVKVKDFIESLHSGSDVAIDKFILDAERIVDEYIVAIANTSTSDYNFLDIKPYDDYTSAHCVSVMLLSLIVALDRHWDALKVKRLGVGALLHDVGKAFIPDEILNKPDKLTTAEFDIMKKHTVYGYDVFKENLPASSLSVIKAHHERVNGTGYPEGKRLDEISDVAKLTSVCDVYDALTSDRAYKRKVLPNIALNIIKNEEQKEFDARMAESFLQVIIPYPKGTAVFLSNGYSGVVKKINNGMRSRPIIKILVAPAGEAVPTFFDINLMTEKNLKIIRVLDDV